MPFQVRFISQRLQKIRHIGGAFHRIMLFLRCGTSEGGNAPASCSILGQSLKIVRFSIKDSQFLKCLSLLLCQVEGVNVIVEVMRTVYKEQFYLHAVVVSRGQVADLQYRLHGRVFLENGLLLIIVSIIKNGWFTRQR